MDRIARLLFAILLVFGAKNLHLEAKSPASSMSVPVVAYDIDSIVTSGLNLVVTAQNIYNTCSDSLFMRADLPEWKRRFETRLKSQETYYYQLLGVGKSLKRELQNRAAFERPQLSDTLTYQALMNDSLVSAGNLRLISLKKCIQYYFFKDNYKFYDDNSLLFIARNLLPDMERYMPRSELTFVLYSMLSQMYSSMQPLGVPSYSEQCVYYARQAMSFENQFDAFTDDELRLIYAMNYTGLLTKYPLVNEVLGMTELRDVMGQLVALLKARKSFFMSPEVKPFTMAIGSRALSYPINCMYEYVIPNAWDLHAPELDKTVQKLLVQMEPDSVLAKGPNFYTYQLLKAYLGETTLTQAWEASQAFLEAHPFNLENMTLEQVGWMHSAYKSLSMMCDSAHIAPDLKHRSMYSYAKQMVEGVKHFVHYKQNDLVASMIYEFTTNERICKYLTSDECKEIYSALLPYTLTDNYANMGYISQMAHILLKGVVDYRPELLVGCFKIKSAKDVKRKSVREMLYENMNIAVAMQDMGCNSMPVVLKNQYRPYSDTELDLLMAHPERSVRVLNMNPDLKPLKDLVLGANKWYNGSLGYPRWFDNRLSSQGILIDILSMCNYMAFLDDGHGRQDLTGLYDFDKISVRLKDGAGSHFNPELVTLLFSHPDVEQSMRKTVNEDWAPIFYKAYSTYFDHSASSEE